MALKRNQATGQVQDIFKVRISSLRRLYTHCTYSNTPLVTVYKTICDIIGEKYANTLRNIERRHMFKVVLFATWTPVFSKQYFDFFTFLLKLFQELCVTRGIDLRNVAWNFNFTVGELVLATRTWRSSVSYPSEPEGGELLLRLCDVRRSLTSVAPMAILPTVDLINPVAFCFLEGVPKQYAKYVHFPYNPYPSLRQMEIPVSACPEIPKRFVKYSDIVLHFERPSLPVPLVPIDEDSESDIPELEPEEVGLLAKLAFETQSGIVENSALWHDYANLAIFAISCTISIVVSETYEYLLGFRSQHGFKAQSGTETKRSGWFDFLPFALFAVSFALPSLPWFFAWGKTATSTTCNQAATVRAVAVCTFAANAASDTSKTLKEHVDYIFNKCRVLVMCSKCGLRHNLCICKHEKWQAEMMASQSGKEGKIVLQEPLTKEKLHADDPYKGFQEETNPDASFASTANDRVTEDITRTPDLVVKTEKSLPIPSGPIDQTIRVRDMWGHWRTVKKKPTCRQTECKTCKFI